ncbi:MAG: Ig-like domain-containing protein [Lachnospiraceae bacterium]|nr:Ig-like domain-containing protein [Lachnospiraceae bacterium]MBP3609150.1 Ig-like domain-containing protein [Lachnospiraceae bacterium]
MNFISFESIPDDMEGKVKQNLKFKTGKFVWKVKFTAPLDPATINNMNLYVTDTSNNPLKTAIHYNSDTNEIEIDPLESYAKDSSYILHISKRVRSVGGQNLKSDISLQFKV